VPVRIRSIRKPLNMGVLKTRGIRQQLSIFLVLILLAVAASIAHSINRTIRLHPDDDLLKPFRMEAQPRSEDYGSLARYFTRGFGLHKSASGAGAAYPGLPSEHSPSVDRMEGFSRMAPLWGAWVVSGRPSAAERLELIATFRRGLLAGTDPVSKGYWGAMQDDDQRIVEASDIALALWLLRDSVWKDLSVADKKQVVAWLQQVNGKSVPDNNWHLFVVFVDAVLEKLASVDNRADAMRHYSRIKEFYRGEGWFSDGPADAFDYYNAWGIHYQLFWLQQVAPDWDKAFIDRARSEFVTSYRYLMTPQGIPILGRSVCYRMAAPVPLILDQFGTKKIDPTEARRAFDSTWQYFISHGGVMDGNITQGYCGSDPRVLDRYSGPASCLWGLRSLIAALYLPRDAEFWKASGGRLPVEQSDFIVDIKSVGWTLHGDRHTGDVEVRRRQGSKAVALRPVSTKDKMLSQISGEPLRPDNHAAEYDAATYSSQHPFCGCK
jgi:hypothetical protein